MNKDLLPVKKEFPKALSELREELENLEGDVFINKGNISILKNTIYNGGADIDKVGNFLGSGKLPPSSNSVKEALTSINNDFKSSFKNTSTVIGHLNDNLSNTLNIIKNMIICMGIITYNQRRDKKASEKAIKRLKDVTEKIKKGEISVSELIDIFAENVEAEAKEYKQLEEKLSQLQSEWQNIQKDLNDKLQTIINEAESLEKSHDSYIKDLNDKLSVTVTDIQNKHEEVSSILKNEQKESLDIMEKHFTDSLAELKQTSDAIAKSQDEFVSQSKEQTSLALSEFQKAAEHKVAEMQEQTDGFIENQNVLFEEMKKQLSSFIDNHTTIIGKLEKQVKIYKAITVAAVFVSIVTAILVLIL